MFQQCHLKGRAHPNLPIWNLFLLDSPWKTSQEKVFYIEEKSKFISQSTKKEIMSGQKLR